MTYTDQLSGLLAGPSLQHQEQEHLCGCQPRLPEDDAPQSSCSNSGSFLIQPLPQQRCCSLLISEHSDQMHVQKDNAFAKAL